MTVYQLYKFRKTVLNLSKFYLTLLMGYMYIALLFRYITACSVNSLHIQCTSSTQCTQCSGVFVVNAYGICEGIIIPGVCPGGALEIEKPKKGHQSKF